MIPSDPVIQNAAVEMTKVAAEAVAQMKAGYLDQDGRVLPFEKFIQYIGPPVGYYINHDGERYRYSVSGWKSDDLEKVVSRVDELAARMVAAGAHTIVWRSKPELEMHDGQWHFYCRFHTLPYLHLEDTKPEGGPFPEA